MTIPSNRRRWALQALAIGTALVGSVVGLSSCFTSGTQDCASIVCPAGFVCSQDGTSCKTPDALCGNGEMDPGEMCDDGNVLRGDGCSVDCTSDETCGNGVIDVDMPNTRENAPAICLNSTATGTNCREECDKGSDAQGNSLNVPGSGCSPNCLSDESCGNSILDTHLPNHADGTIPPQPCLSNDSNTNCVELCDDGDNDPDDDCSPNCLSIEMCGNGIVDVHEMCDDGDRDDASGCRNDCQSSAECGDGEVGPGEECDDMDESVSCDGPAATDGDACTIRVCGDGYVNAVAGTAADGTPIPGEICDPGTIGGDIDDCDRDCTRPSCGDGITNIAADEQCDDGPTASLVNGDGCSTTCQLEPFSLAVTRVGSGTGTVTGLPGINCGTDCFEPYALGSMITLTAAPAIQSTFNGWLGCDTVNGSNQCLVTMTSARAVVATFETNTLTVVRDGTGSGAVTGTGINCGPDCTETYDTNTMVTLTAAPVSATSDFTGWSVASCPATSLTCTVTMTAARTVTATFTLRLFALTVSKTGNGTGVVSSVPAGITCGVDCNENYVSGTTVTLFASPNSDSDFGGWSFGTCGTAVSCNVPMTMAQSVTATFTLKTFVLTATRSGSGSGTVVSAPAGINCGSDCTETYNIFTPVMLTATPAVGSRFVGWSGACAGTGPCNVTMDIAKTVNAEFRIEFLLTVTRSGSGTGTVTSDPAGINCGTDCTELYDTGTTVILTPTPAAGSRFVMWTGACTGTGPCSVAMTAVRTVNAEFRTVYDLTVTKAGTGVGTVTSSPSGISCGIDCAETYDVGSIVTLTQTPAAGSRFSGWSGACTGSGACVVTMDAAKTVTATYIAIYDLTVTKIGSGAGTVTSSPTGINCGTDCVETYDVTTVVMLTAAPAVGSRFVQWTGDCTGTGPCSVTMDAAKTVTAEFRTEFLLTVTKLGSGGGSVDSAPTGITCGTDCTQLYDVGTSVTLTPTPDGTSRFVQWTGACTGSGACIVDMTAARTVNAEFRAVRILTVAKAGTGAGTVTSSPTGINCGGDCTETYDLNTSVTLTAVAATGSRFVGWSGGGCSGTGTCVTLADATKTVTATFNGQFVLSVAKIGGGSGTVSSSPAGINCGTDCSEPYDSGDIVTITQVAAAGSRFVQWTGACTGSAACVVTVDAAKTVTAEFRETFVLTVTKTGSGTVTSDVGGINCGTGPGCVATYDVGTDVTLVATPTAGSRFVQWTGACTGTSTCVVTMSQARTVNAEFRVIHLLTVNKTGTGTGAISAVPTGTPGITAANCGNGVTPCTSTFDVSTSVVLTAVPAAGSTIGTWIGCDTSTTTTCTVAMTAAKTVSLSFSAVFTLTVAKTGSASGTVTSAPAGINCGSDCTENYNGGQVVVLTASTGSENAFTGWSAGCTATTITPTFTCTLTMDASKTITANFEDNTLTLDLIGSGDGDVVSDNHAGTNSLNCNENQSGNCEEDYNQGTVVVLTATAPSGSRFVRWIGGGCPVTTPPATPPPMCSVTMSAPVIVQAEFSLIDTLTVTKSGAGTGTVVSNPTGINCVGAGPCNATFDRNTLVTMTATPAAGMRFVAWTGDCVNTPPDAANVCTVTMNGNRNSNAQFEPNTLTVVLAGPAAAGSVTSLPVGISCGVDCTENYNVGQVVVLAAAPAVGSTFTGWSGGGCSGTGGCSVTLTTSTTVTATFTTP